MNQIIANLFLILTISSNTSPPELTQSITPVESVEVCKNLIKHSISSVLGRTVEAKCVNGSTNQVLVKMRCVKDGFFSNDMTCRDTLK
jgi:hypothetical protein